MEASIMKERIRYGDDDLQFGDLSYPTETTDARDHLVVLVHGGFWRNPYRLDLMEPMTQMLVDSGYLVWNIEYRAVGDVGGGYPGTLEDLWMAYRLILDQELAEGFRFDRVTVVGHSAGGHLGLWLGSAHLLTGRSDLSHSLWELTKGAQPPVPDRVIGLAPVVDLEAAYESGMGSGAVENFLGASPASAPDRYAVAQPVLDSAWTFVIHGTNDDRVPLEHVEEAITGSEVSLSVIDGADHFDVIKPGTNAFDELVRLLEAPLV